MAYYEISLIGEYRCHQCPATYEAANQVYDLLMRRLRIEDSHHPRLNKALILYVNGQADREWYGKGYPGGDDE